MANPVRLDPFQNIVNVGWGGGTFAVVRTRQVWTGAGGPPTLLVALPQLGVPIPIPEVAILAGIYENDDVEGGGPVTTTTTTYTYEVSYSRPPDSGFATGEITVVSDGTSSFWFITGGTMGGEGGIAEAEAAILEDGFWQTFSAFETGSSSETTSSGGYHVGERNSVWLFDLKLLRLAISGDNLAIGVALSDVAGVEGGPIPSVEWDIFVDTFRGVTKNSFPVTGTAVPAAGWKAPVASRHDSGFGATAPLYLVNFADLSIATP